MQIFRFRNLGYKKILYLCRVEKYKNMDAIEFQSTFSDGIARAIPKQAIYQCKGNCTYKPLASKKQKGSSFYRFWLRNDCRL